MPPSLQPFPRGSGYCFFGLRFPDLLYIYVEPVFTGSDLVGGHNRGAVKLAYSTLDIPQAFLPTTTGEHALKVGHPPETSTTNRATVGDGIIFSFHLKQGKFVLDGSVRMFKKNPLPTSFDWSVFNF